MLASGPTILSALCLIQAETHVDVGGRFETRVGQAPTGAQTTSGQLAEQSQVMIVATPVLGLRWLEGVDSFRADSATRILWRPVPRFDARPLFLESLDVAHSRRPTRRSQWQLNLTGAYGEQDYLSLSQQFANQPTLPTAVTTLNVGAVGDALWRSSRTTTLTLRIAAQHRRALDAPATSSAAPVAFVLPTQTSVTVVPLAAFLRSRRTALEVSAPLADYDIQGITQTQPVGTESTSQQGHANYATVQPQLALVESLTRHHYLRLTAGFTYAVSLRDTAMRGAWHPLSPLAQVELNALWLRTRAATLRYAISAGTTWFADPILGQTVQRGIAQARIDAELGPSWSAGLRMAFVTDLFDRLPTPAGGPPFDESFRSVDVSARRRFAHAAIAEFGARYAERAPYLSPSNYLDAFGSGWHNRELWAFLTLTTEPRRPARPR
jgi:hypothetical protein